MDERKRGEESARKWGKGKPGVYEFDDARHLDDVKYNRQGKDMGRRLGDWKRAGAVEDSSTVWLKEVKGGKTAREVEEFNRIRKNTGGVPARKSNLVSNKVGPISKKRRKKLQEKGLSISPAGGP